MRAVFINHCHPEIDHVCGMRAGRFAEAMVANGHKIVLLTQTLHKNNDSFPPEELEAGTMKLVGSILSRGPIAVRFAIEAISRGSNMPQREGEILESDLFGLAASTEDMREGMSAFLEKRKPHFQGK